MDFFGQYFGMQWIQGDKLYMTIPRQTTTHIEMVEVITMKTENKLRHGVLIGLKVKDTVSLQDVVAHASSTLGIDHELSSLRQKMQKVMKHQTNNETLQQMYVSPTSIALVMYLDCPRKTVPDVSGSDTVQFILTKLEDTIQNYVHQARTEKLVSQSECDYSVFKEPILWTGVEPKEEEAEHPLKIQNDIVMHQDATIENLICIRKYFVDLFGQEDTFTARMNEFGSNGL